MSSEAATILPADTSAARYCKASVFEIYSDGSGVVALLERDGFGFACHYLGGRVKRYLTKAPSRNAKPPKRVLSMVERDFQALLDANLTDELKALGAAMYGDTNG